MQYSHARFIAYAIPTTPAGIINIGNPNGPGSLAGYYLGDDDFSRDSKARIDVLKSAVDSAKAEIPDSEEGVINTFVAPEFYFHGASGPYIYTEEQDDPAVILRDALAETFNATDYPNWMFVFGSVISSCIKNPEFMFASQSVTTRNNIVKSISDEWTKSSGPLQGVIFDMLINFIKVCHAYPNVEVRARSVIVNNMGISSPQDAAVKTNLMTTEKYYCSNEDFLLYDTKSSQRVVTEQMVAYPVMDLSGGDSKQSDFDVYAIFRQEINLIQAATMDYGVEICLDHSDQRLRRNIDNEPAPIVAPHVQLIPSCGMQIVGASVATDCGGIVFNCDGQYALNEESSGASELNSVSCVYANYKEGDYAAHSQLARVHTAPVGGDPKAAGSRDAAFTPLSESLLQCFPVSNPPGNLDQYFSGGAGELHIYGLTTPLELYP